MLINTCTMTLDLFILTFISFAFWKKKTNMCCTQHVMYFVIPMLQGHQTQRQGNPQTKEMSTMGLMERKVKQF